MKPKTKAEKLNNLVREAVALAGYRYPKYRNFEADLVNIINHSTEVKWISTCNVLKHMHNYHRLKLLKHCPELFTDIDLFTLMLCAFIREEDIAELAISYVPKLKSQSEYQKLLSAIPDDDLQGFKHQAEKLLPYKLNSETDNLDLSFYVNEPEKHDVKATITSGTALATASAALYYSTNSYAVSIPVMWALYSLYQLFQSCAAPAKKYIRYLPYSSLWSEKNAGSTSESDSSLHAGRFSP